MQKRAITFWLALVAVLWGCAVHTGPRTWSSRPATQAVARSGYAIAITPVKGQKPFYTAFAFSIENRGLQPLEIDWQASRYLFDDKKSGRFMFAGLSPEDIKKTLPADVVAAGERLEKEIWPITLVAFAPYRDQTVKAGRSGFSRGVMPAGKNGIRLVLGTAGKTVVETLSVVISSGK